MIDYKFIFYLFMSIPDDYLILDTRGKAHFKTQSYSNYLKKDVISIFQKKILESDIEETCYWAVELMLSLAFDTIIDKLIMISFKYINTSAPKLPYYMWTKLDFFINYLKHPEEMRNNQVARNHIIELCVILCISSKGKPLSLIAPSKHKLDLNNITTHLEANFNYLETVKRADDPEDISIFLNELAHSMKHKNFEKAVMWLTYIINYDKIVKKNKKILLASKRINTKDGNNIIWYIWDLIITLSKVTLSTEAFSQVTSLYYIQKKRGYKLSDIYILLAAIKFNTHIYHLNSSLFTPFMIQATSRVNFLFLEAKQIENNKLDITKTTAHISFAAAKKPKKIVKQKHLEQKINNKLKQMELIDMLIQKKSNPTTQTLSNLIDIQKSLH